MSTNPNHKFLILMFKCTINCICECFVINIYSYWIYTAKNGGDICQLGLCNGLGYILPTIGPQLLGDICMSPGVGLGNVHYVIYINWYQIFSANNLGIYVSWIYVLVLDICCQHLGDICQLEVFCAPFERWVG